MFVFASERYFESSEYLVETDTITSIFIQKANKAGLFQSFSVNFNLHFFFSNTRSGQALDGGTH